MADEHGAARVLDARPWSGPHGAGTVAELAVLRPQQLPQVPGGNPRPAYRSPPSLSVEPGPGASALWVGSPERALQNARMHPSPSDPARLPALQSELPRQVPAAPGADLPAPR